MEAKIIFITAASRGFGRTWAEAALKKGHKVIATARDISSLKGLSAEFGDAILPLKLDVRDRKNVFTAVEEGARHFGRIDTVINVAGFSLYGAIEEMTEEESRNQMETNLFGPLWVTQAVLPIMRAQQTGHIIQISSVGGLITFPTLGLYHASKWGLEAISETLSKEVHAFGIKVTLVEPGTYETGKEENPPVQQNKIPAYDPLRVELYKHFQGKKGDPYASTGLMMTLIEHIDPPLRLFLGSQPYPLVTAAYHNRLSLWDAWKDASDLAQGD